MRARSLKPSLFKNELLGTADPLITILFEGLWCEADREGRLEDRPLRIRAEVFPYRSNIDIESMLDWLVQNDFIVRYKAGGVAIIQVRKFLDHQRPHNNEVKSVLAPESEADQHKAKRTSNQGKKPAQPRKEALRSDSGLLNPSSLTPDSGNHDSPQETSASPPQPKPERIVFEHWQREWNHPEAVLDEKRLGRIRARLRHFTAEQICSAISGFKNSDWHTGMDPKGNGVVYDKIETLLRDDGQIEKGLQFYAHPPRPPPKPIELSPVERVMRANGLTGGNDERVVSEQHRNGSGEGLGDIFGDVRQPPHAGLRRVSS